MKPINHTFSTNLKRNNLLFLGTILLCFITQFTIAQTVRTVDNRAQAGAQYTSVQDAINASSTTTQDIIYIHPSPTAYGNISIDRSIILVGPGHNPANSNGLRATLGTITLNTNSESTIIKGLNIGSITAFSFGTNSDDIHIINNRITSGITGYFNGTASQSWVIEGNYFDTAYTTTNITGNFSVNWNILNNFFSGVIREVDQTSIVTNNLFVSDDPIGTTDMFPSCNFPLIANNIFVWTDPDVTGISSANVEFNNCLTWKEAGGVALTALPGSGNLNNMDPLFNNLNDPGPAPSIIDFYNNDFTLKAGSPGLNAGTDGTDLGLYGNNFTFDVNGRPHFMPYPTDMAILNTVIQPGQTLNVTFKATQKN